MPIALPLQNKLSRSSSKRKSYRTLTNPNGNGYKQYALDGFNTIDEEWTLIWNYLTETEYATIDAGCDLIGGHDYFIWTPWGPNETEKKWQISSQGIDMNMESGGYYMHRKTIYRVYR